MGKRFGRNQKRRMRAELAAVERELATAEFERMQAHHDAERKIRRMRERMLEVNVALLQIPERMMHELRCKVFHAASGADYSIARRFDEHDARVTGERARFVHHVASVVAADMAHQFELNMSEVEALGRLFDNAPSPEHNRFRKLIGAAPMKRIVDYRHGRPVDARAAYRPLPRDWRF